MLKNIGDISNILNIKNQKKDFDDNIENILNILNNDYNLVLEKKDILLKNNIIKIKTNSDKKFVLFINLSDITNKIKNINKDFTIEL